jgi:anti-sigma factor RsiW
VTCRECADCLLAYVDGVLAPAARDAFGAHLARCPDCANYLRQYRETIAAAGAAFADDDADLPEALVAAILAARLSDPRESDPASPRSAATRLPTTPGTDSRPA